MIRTKCLMRQWLTPYVVLLAIGSFVSVPAAAAEARASPAQAAEFVEDLSSRAVTLLTEYPDSDSAGFQTELRDLIRESFDLELMGRFAAGTSWLTATPAQRQEYQELFTLWTAESYATRLGTARGAALTVTGAQQYLDTADAVVQTRLNRPNGISHNLNLRVRDSDGQMKIIDVGMGGVSMAVTQRDEFASIIQRKGLGGLIGDLKDGVSDIRLATSER